MIKFRKLLTNKNLLFMHILYQGFFKTRKKKLRETYSENRFIDCNVKQKILQQITFTMKGG